MFNFSPIGLKHKNQNGAGHILLCENVFIVLVTLFLEINQNVCQAPPWTRQYNLAKRQRMIANESMNLAIEHFVI